MTLFFGICFLFYFLDCSQQHFNAQVKSLTDEQIFLSRFSLTSLKRCCLRHDAYTNLASFLFDRKDGQVFTLLFFSMTSALFEKLAC